MFCHMSGVKHVRKQFPRIPRFAQVKVRDRVPRKYVVRARGLLSKFPRFRVHEKVRCLFVVPLKMIPMATTRSHCKRGTRTGVCTGRGSDVICNAPMHDLVCKWCSKTLDNTTAFYAHLRSHLPPGNPFHTPAT